MVGQRSRTGLHLDSHPAIPNPLSGSAAVRRHSSAHPQVASLLCAPHFAQPVYVQLAVQRHWECYADLTKPGLFLPSAPLCIGIASFSKGPKN